MFVIERLLDIAARELGIDRAEIRRRNFIPADAFPYDNEMIYQDFAPLSYDSGNYRPILDKALAMIGYDASSRRSSRGCAPPAATSGSASSATWRAPASGRTKAPGCRCRPTARSASRPASAPRGRDTSPASPRSSPTRSASTSRDVDVVTGDTDQFYWGAGTFASRGAVVAGNAVNAAAKRCARRSCGSRPSISNARRGSRDRRWRVAIVGVPGKTVRLGELALKANPMRGAVRPGTEPGLESTEYFGPPRGATASGVHAMIVEVDPETLALEISKYVVVHDCGTVINPLILAGQVHGGVAQGIGNAFYEQLVFDDDGQLLNASLADYLLPTALEVPRIDLAHTVTPSPLNPLGIKGAGRSGRDPGRPAVRAGDRGCAGAARGRRRDSGNSAQPEPAMGADDEEDVSYACGGPASACRWASCKRDAHVSDRSRRAWAKSLRRRCSRGLGCDQRFAHVRMRNALR